MPEEAEQQIKSELELYEQEQSELQKLEQELQADPKFAQFLEARQKFAEFDAQVWKRVEQVMLDNNIKSIKTDKVTLTIAERMNLGIDTDLLPKKYTKVVPNTTLINNEYKLTNVLVKGTYLKDPTLYLTKRFKKEQ